MIVRWGLGQLPSLLLELGVARPLLLCSPRGAAVDLPGLDIPLDRRHVGDMGHAAKTFVSFRKV